MKEPIELTYNEDGTIQLIDAFLGDSIAADAHAKWSTSPRLLRPPLRRHLPRPRPPTENWGHSSFASKKGRTSKCVPLFFERDLKEGA